MEIKKKRAPDQFVSVASFRWVAGSPPPPEKSHPHQVHSVLLRPHSPRAPPRLVTPARHRVPCCLTIPLPKRATTMASSIFNLSEKKGTFRPAAGRIASRGQDSKVPRPNFHPLVECAEGPGWVRTNATPRHFAVSAACKKCEHGGRSGQHPRQMPRAGRTDKVHAHAKPQGAGCSAPRCL